MELIENVKVINNISNEHDACQIYKQIIEALKEVYDPDIYYSIYDIGLIYEIHIDNNLIKIIMTLTSVNCPHAQTIPANIQEEIKRVKDFSNYIVEVIVVFDPPWTIDNMADEIKLRLGLL